MIEFEILKKGGWIVKYKDRIEELYWELQFKSMMNTENLAEVLNLEAANNMGRFLMINE